MSIDLMRDVTYTVAQLVRYENRLIASSLPFGEEATVNRGYSMRDETKPPATPPGLVDRSGAYTDHLANVSAHMATMRADNELLIGTLEYERAVDRLAQPPYGGPAEIPGGGEDENGDPIMVPNPEYVKDQAERAAAQSVVDGASVEVIVLYEIRNPS